MRKIVVAQKPFYSKVKKEKVHQELLNIIPTYDGLPENQKEFLVKLWLKNYEYGTRVIKKDSFVNNKLVTCQDLSTRFYQYPEVKNNDLNFIKQVAEENGNIVDAILGENANQDDFIYETYESNYIDKSLDVLKAVVVPKDFEEIDVSLVSQDGFADGAMTKIEYLAKNALSQMAIKKIKDMQ